MSSPRNGWTMYRLDDPKLGISIQPGFACGKKDVDGGVPHLRMNNISSDGLAVFSLVRRIPTNIAEQKNRWLEIDDILFCNTNSTDLVGKTCLFRGWEECCTFSNHLTRLRVESDSVTPEWLSFCLRHFWLNRYFAIHCTEFIGQSSFNKDKLEDVTIPVPPMKEQRRIVARIKALTRRADQARRLRKEAIEEAQSMFQSELRQAFSPESTAGWRLYGAKELFTAVKGQVDPTVSPYADMPHIGPDCIESGSGRIISEKIQTPRQLNLKSGKYAFHGGHVLYSKIRPALRKVCLPDFEGVCSADMYPLEPTRLISREFLALSILSPAFTDYTVANSSRNAMPKVNRKALFAHRMPVPDAKTRDKIARRLFEIQAEAVDLSRLQTESDTELAAFTPALLAKVFRGEL